MPGERCIALAGLQRSKNVREASAACMLYHRRHHHHHDYPAAKRVGVQTASHPYPVQRRML